MLDSPEPQTGAAPTLPRKPPRRWRVVRTLFKTSLLVILLGLGLLSYEVISSGTSPGEVIRQISRLIASQDRPLAGETEGRINLLLLGVGGNGHEGPLLTDSMLLVSLQPATKRVAVISVPRDLQVEIPGYGERRINSAYALTNINHPGQGGSTIRQIVSAVFNVPVHYSVLLDFSGFTELIDAVGGIDLTVASPLDDEFYPVAGKEAEAESERYEHLIIPAGRQHFDGSLALKYVRSRKAKGAQGSDFARSRRQQEVLAAVRDQLIGFGSLRPGRISELLRLVNAHLDTNLETWEMLRLYQLGRDLDPASVVRHVMDDRPDGLLVASSTVDGAFVLLPRVDDFRQLQQLAQDPFTPWPYTQALPEPQTTPEPAATASPAPDGPIAATRTARLQIHNGTSLTGLAALTESFLRREGYAIVSVGNAPLQTYLKTVVYNLKPPAHRDAQARLAQLLDAVSFESGPPQSPGSTLPYPIAPGADFLIILGKNATERVPEL